MSEQTHGEHTASASSSTALFSPAEAAALRASDVQAAKSVVLLMVGVFTLGLVLYAIVALSVL